MNAPALVGWKWTALEPVWVEHEPGHVPEKKSGSSREKRPGPNGEDPESGDWKLQWPDGRIHKGPTVSPSSLETATECFHKWALDKIANLPRTENHKAELGNERHAELEAWQRFGTAPTTRGMAKVFQHFPAPGAGEPECYFGFALERPGQRVIVFAGYMDARVSAADEATYVEQDDGIIDVIEAPLNSTVWDLKTTGDVRWFKTPAQLKANIQAAIYALNEMLRVEAKRGVGANGTSFVFLKWVYALQKEHKTGECEITRVECVDEGDLGAQASVTMTRDNALEVIGQYIGIADQILEALEKAERKEITAADVPKNGNACAMYGGCGWKKMELPERVPGAGTEMACTPPEGGGGFKALLSQEMARRAASNGEVFKGIFKKSENKSEVSGAPMQIGSGSGTKKLENKMTLASRFASKVTGTTPVEKPVEVEKPAEKQVQQTSGASETSGTVSKGLGARFAKKTAEAAATPTGPETAKVDGMASGAVAGASSASSAGATVAGASGAKPSNPLMARLGQFKPTTGASAADVQKAAENAPTQAVTSAVGAVGINPADVAPELSQAEQIAEGERLAAAGKAAVSGELADAAKSNTTTTTDAPKRGRGRPAGSKSSANASAEDVAVAASNGDVLPVLDVLVQGLMASGKRREATILLGASAEIQALAG